MTDEPINLAEARRRREPSGGTSEFMGAATRQRAQILTRIMLRHGLSLPEETAVRLMTALLVDERMDALGIVHRPIWTWPERVNQACDEAQRETENGGAE